MLKKSWFPILTKTQISGLRGGEKHDCYYFVGICESAESDVLTNVMYVKLRGQKRSVRWSRFPDGYEPFQTIYGTKRLCLKTMTIQVPRLSLLPIGWPNPAPTPRIVYERKLAGIINPPRCTEAFEVLMREEKTFEIKHRIRRHAAQSRATFDLVLSLMTLGGSPPLCEHEPADRFEAYLCLRSPEFLQVLLELLEMPDPLPKPSDPQLLRAA